MEVKQIKNILEAPYNRTVWKDFIKTQFTNNNLLANDTPLNLGKNDIYKECYSLGNYAVDEYTKVGIFEVQLADKVNLTRNRVALRNLIKDITKQVAGAMVVFVQGDKWRFSYISKRKLKNKETGTIEDKETAPKRYTYLFGKNEKALTAAIRFDKLIQKQQGNIFQFLTLNDFEEAFSVEKLSKDFFNEYKKSYEDFVEFITGKRYVKKGNKFIETVIRPANFQLKNLFGNDEKQARDFCKRMMGRIVFLYFIQKKGWLAVAQGKKWGEGNQDYLFDLFKNSKNKDDFYSQELVPLFFKTLNNTASEKETNTLRFPYLNGGLFDDSHDRKFNKLAMPTEIFENLFNTFNNFNFTIYEDAPDEHTVAVDPEMLGHIFENLLEDNKDKGAFYTPKEIVHYMCKESLCEYINGKLFNEGQFTVNNSQLTIRKIIQQQELSKEEIVFAEKNAFKIIDALEQVKICDPAIGSGAFPMGLLQEIFNAQIYLQELKGFKKGTTDAQIKKHIIEESIYGVDIDAGAVDIARLRFWLSLVVDEEVPQPLPNLDFKIVCANTLIPLGKIKNLDMGGTKEIADGLAQVRHDYFNASMEEKTALETKFTSLQKKLLTTAKEWVSKDDAAVYQRLLEFSPFEDTSCTWFDAWWMFGVNDGFDIVIGNPPYVSVKSISAKEKKIFTSVFITAIGQFDLYGLFIEKAFDLLKKDAVFSMITSNTFLNNKDFYPLRKKLILESTILSVANLDETIFESAQVDVSILIFKTSKSNESQIKVFSNKENFLQGKFEEIAQSQFNNETLQYEFKLNCTKQDLAIIDVIFNNNTPLKNILDLPRGIELGSNSELIEIKKTANNQKLLVGRDIKKYQINFGNRYITFNETDKSNFKSIEIYKQDKLLIQRIRNLSLKERIIATIDLEEYLCTNTLRIGILKDFSFSLKYLLALINSKVINFVFLKYFLNKDIYAYQLEQIPIAISKAESPFVNLVDYLLFLNDKNSEQIFTHTTNARLAAHIEDVLNMMVYELYFEGHMKEIELDVITFVSDELDKMNNDDKLKDDLPKAIEHFYLWLQTPDNQVRQRINIVDIKSPNILSKINLATQ